uniref:Uncharacterized protein n=1 Tax=Vitis vinifera TaxID=29760 RepID=F6I4Y5_VITVI
MSGKTCWMPFECIKCKQKNMAHVLCGKLEEVIDERVVVDTIEMIDGVVLHDEYQDEMDMITMIQINNIVQLQPVSPFDMFGVSTIEVVEET